MTDTAYRDLASEIGLMFQDDRLALAVAFVDTLIAAGDLDDLERWRRTSGESGAAAVRNLLARRIDTAPLPGGGMSAIFAIPVFGRPGPFSPELVAEQVSAAWGPGLVSLSVDRSYRGLDGVPTDPAERMRIAKICAQAGTDAALRALPRARRRNKRAWDPCLIVCAATTAHDRDVFETGSNILLDSLSANEAARWAAQASACWAGAGTDVCLPDLLGAAIEIARMQSVIKQILVVSSWARGGLLDVLRLADGALLLTSEAAGTYRVDGAGFLTDRRIVEATAVGGTFAGIRHPLQIVRSH